MPLSDTKIRHAKPGPSSYKLYDGEGIYLEVTPAGGKLWRLKYKFLCKEQKLALGAYPTVGLKDARAAALEARKLLAAGKNPAVEKKRAQAAAVINATNSFKAVAEELIEKGRREGRAAITCGKAEWLLVKFGSSFGARPVAEIAPFEILEVLRGVERAGHLETARRMLSFASRVFRYAIATTRANTDPASMLRGALTSPTPKHHAAIIEPAAVGALLRAIDGYDGEIATRLALRMAPHVFVRPGELRQAQWREIDLEGAVWRIPAVRMKMRTEHQVPLSSQVVAILKEIQPYSGRGTFVFPSILTPRRPMCENTLNTALRRMGYTHDEMTSHGFRTLASTLLNESGKWRVDVIERALAHSESNQVRAAYNRASMWSERVEMAQWWSDYLDDLRSVADVVPFRRAG